MNKTTAYWVSQNVSPFWTHFLGCFPDCYFPRHKDSGNLFDRDASSPLITNGWTPNLKHEDWMNFQQYHFLWKELSTSDFHWYLHLTLGGRIVLGCRQNNGNCLRLTVFSLRAWLINSTIRGVWTIFLMEQWRLALFTYSLWLVTR